MINNLSYGIYSAELDLELNKALTQLKNENVMARLWAHDYALWQKEPDEITNRLNWLHLPVTMQNNLSEISRFSEGMIKDGIKTILLLGMGGSSLAPEVFQGIFGSKPGFPTLSVLDSTDPAAVKNYAQSLDVGKTLFIVSTKSGGTVETLSFFKYFYNLIRSEIDKESPGSRFIAITDPGSSLESLARKVRVRKIFISDPNLGGRYSALSLFGLVPAALIGVDIQYLLNLSEEEASRNGQLTNPFESLGANLGAFLGIAANAGKDKVTFFSSPIISSFENWVEQLVAESTGKSGKGILPVVGEPIPADLNVLSKDRVFVISSFGQDETMKALAQKLKRANHPVIEFQINDKYDLGKLIFVWEFATAIAGYFLKIHPFNQPDVEAAKILARQSLKKYEDSGTLPSTSVLPFSKEALLEFLENTQTGDYISLQAYMQPSAEIREIFRSIQGTLRDEYRIPVTFGFGPRFLHSTGQLHKGDSGNGLFIQLISTTPDDLDIPDQAGRPESHLSFGVLKRAQAIGDARALSDAKRRVVSFQINGNLPAVLDAIAKEIQA